MLYYNGTTQHLILTILNNAIVCYMYVATFSWVNTQLLATYVKYIFSYAAITEYNCHCIIKMTIYTYIVMYTYSNYV